MVAVALALGAGVAGLVIYVLSQNQSRTPARVGLAVDAEGRPELLTAQCPRRWVGSAAVSSGKGSDAVVWRADAVGQVGVSDLPMSGPIPGYRIVGDLGNVAPEMPLELGPVINDRGVHIGESMIVFRQADLRSDEVLVGLEVDGSLSFTSRSDFAAPLPGC